MYVTVLDLLIAGELSFQLLVKCLSEAQLLTTRKMLNGIFGRRRLKDGGRRQKIEWSGRL